MQCRQDDPCVSFQKLDAGTTDLPNTEPRSTAKVMLVDNLIGFLLPED